MLHVLLVFLCSICLLYTTTAIPVTSTEEGIELPDAVPNLSPALPSSSYALPAATAQLEPVAPDAVPPPGWGVTPPDAINPIYLNVSGDKLLKRADSGPLYGASGKPTIDDVHQTTNPSCGFASSLAAVVNVASDWITSKVTVGSDFSAAPQATVEMYDPTSLTPKSFTIQCADTAAHSDIDPATGVWWPGLYDHAAVDLGLGSTDGALGPVLPMNALEAITGLKATGQTGLSADYLFTLLGNSASKKTPMVLQTTSNGAKTLVGGHAYAVIGTSGTGDGRQVTLYNPWGTQVTQPLAAVLPDTYYVWYLQNFDTWTGRSSNAAPDTTPTTQATTAPPPAPTTTTPAPAPAPHTTDNQVNALAEVDTQSKGGDNVVWVTEVVTVVVHV